MLFAYSSPENIVICQSFPLLAHLSGAAQGSGIQVSQNLQGDFPGQDGEWIDTNEVCELLGKQGKLRKATHGEDALKDECPT
jgi:hypothetical protein